MATNPDPTVNSQASAHPAQSAFDAVVSALTAFRRGGKTTECAISFFAAIMPMLLALLDKLSATTAGIITGIAALGYHLLRGAQKSGQNDQLLSGLQTIAEHIRETPAPVVALPIATPPAPQTSLEVRCAAPDCRVNADADATKIIPAPQPAGNAGHITFGLCAVTAALGALACLLFGCAGFTENLAKIQASPVTQAIERDALNIGLRFAEASITGQDINAAWGMSEGLNTIVDAVKALPNPKAQVLVRDTAMAFAGSKNANVSILASDLAQAFGDAAPKTPEERAAAVLALANGISQALAQPAQPTK